MNGTCAGGTGAFIDQMATLLHTDASGLNELAANATTIYPIASRCGVFAKTDVQPLLNERPPRRRGRSIFQAVVTQTISGLRAADPFAATSPSWAARCSISPSCATASTSRSTWTRSTVSCPKTLTCLWRAVPPWRTSPTSSARSHSLSRPSTAWATRRC